MAETQNATALPTMAQPSGIPESYSVYARLMIDLQVLAMQADLTRVGTLMFGRENGARSYPETGVPDGHHPLSHHGNDPEKMAKLTKINTYHMEQVAYFFKTHVGDEGGRCKPARQHHGAGRRRPCRSQPPRSPRSAGSRGGPGHQGQPAYRRQAEADDGSVSDHDGRSGRTAGKAWRQYRPARPWPERADRKDEQGVGCRLIAAWRAAPALAGRRKIACCRRCATGDLCRHSAALAAPRPMSTRCLPDKSRCWPGRWTARTRRAVRLLLAAGARPRALAARPLSLFRWPASWAIPAIVSALLKAGANAREVRRRWHHRLCLCAGASTPEVLAAYDKPGRRRQCRQRPGPDAADVGGDERQYPGHQMALRPWRKSERGGQEGLHGSISCHSQQDSWRRP